MTEARIQGPYSVHVTSKEHIVRGRHGAIIRRYPSAAKDAAMEDLRRLQKGYTAEQKLIRDAAPELLTQLEYAVKLLGAFPTLNGTAQVQSMRDTIAKARGEVA